MDIFEKMTVQDTWEDFLQYKIEKQHISKAEIDKWKKYIEEKKYLSVLQGRDSEDFDFPLPVKKEINKGNTGKKRAVYSYPEYFSRILKLMAFLLYEYDFMFARNCYAFRQGYGIKDAVMRIRTTKGIEKKYCLKVDISNYFNSIDVPLLIEKLDFLRKEDIRVYNWLVTLLRQDAAVVEGTVKKEKRGAMAGTPISPFLANVYLSSVDSMFEDMGVLYFRYSDDILLFADSKEEILRLQELLYTKMDEYQLKINQDKVCICAPGESWDFLGLSYVNGKVDLSKHTKWKIKRKIKRKAQALIRWKEKKGLQGEQAAKGFIKAMNYKFFASENGTEFTWSRWFFPNLTTIDGLKEIDAYMQQYIRYCVTGKHNKGNYKVKYESMKKWGYRNLVHEYYKSKRSMNGSNESREERKA